MSAVFKRELASYFKTPTGYIFMAVFMALSGLIFNFTTFMMSSSDTGSYFMFLLFVFIIVIPILTMKLLSEERKSRTEQILLTSPVSIGGIITAKYLAAYVMFFITFALSEIIHFSFLSVYAEELNCAKIFGNFIGICLVGGAFIAIGLFLSSLTESQVVAAITTTGAIILLVCMSFAANSVANDFLRLSLKWISILSRFSPFAYGIFDIPSVLYYISLSVIFVFLTVRVYEKRRWS